MRKQILIALICLIGLAGCGSVPTQTVQTTHLNFAIPSYRQKIDTAQRQDIRSGQTGSVLIEYTNITNSNDFVDLIQANKDTLKQNLGTQLQEDIISTPVNISCSGNTLTGEMISFAIHQNEDVLYLSQIFTIQDTDITAISIASFSSDIRSETANNINDTMTCKS